MFNKRSQEQSKTIDAYITTLRQLANTCNYEEMEDRMLRDQIVVGIKDDIVCEKLLEDRKLALSYCVEMCRAYESSTMPGHNISHSVDVDRLKVSQPTQGSNRKQIHTASTRQPMFCARCGRYAHSYDECPARQQNAIYVDELAILKQMLILYKLMGKTLHFFGQYVMAAQIPG